MASTPAFVATGMIGVANVAAANTATDGTGTITTLATGAASGTRVMEIEAKAAATTAAGVINLFLSVDGGTTWRIFDSIVILAITQSTTVAGYRAVALYDNLILPSTSHKIGVANTIAQSVNVIALGGNL